VPTLAPGLTCFVQSTRRFSTGNLYAPTFGTKWHPTRIEIRTALATGSYTYHGAKPFLRRRQIQNRLWLRLIDL